MNLSYRELLPAGFAPTARVWVYQSNRLLSMGETLQVDEILQHFVSQWQSHGAKVNGFATVFFGQFIILMADDSVSGCSTDSSVRVIKLIEETFKVSLFDRQLLAFVVKDKLQLVPMAQLKHAVTHGMIAGDDLFFNNVVTTKAELENNWIIPLNQSWLASRLELPAS